MGQILHGRLGKFNILVTAPSCNFKLQDQATCTADELHRRLRRLRISACSTLLQLQVAESGHMHCR